MKKILPITLKTSIISECWTFYRLAIVESCDHLKPWLHNRFHNIYINRFYELLFGQSGQIYNHLQYYRDVLTTKEKPLHEIEGTEDIICFIKEQINKENYLLMQLDSGVLMNRPTYFMGMLIYGYDDDKKEIYILRSVEGEFKELKFCYSKIIKSFCNVRKHFTNLEKYPLELVRMNYIITKFSVKKEVDFNTDLSTFYQDVCYHILADNRVKTFEAEKGLKPDVKYWDGMLGCHFGMVDLIDKMQSNHEDMKWVGVTLSLNIKKIHEHFVMYINKMQFFDELYGLEIGEALFGDAQRCAKKLEICYLLAFKYEQSKQDEILPKLKSKLLKIYSDKKQFLLSLKKLVENHDWRKRELLKIQNLKEGAVK